MAKITMEEQDSILTFPVDSILDLLIEELEIKEVAGRNGPWKKMEVKFKVLGIQALGKPGPNESGDPADYENWITQNIYGSVPFKLTDHPENKLRMWAEAIFNQELGPGFELDTDMFVKRRVRGLTGQYDAKARDSAGNPFKRHEIVSLLASKDGSATMATQQQAPPVAQDPWGAPQAPAPEPASQEPQPVGQPTDPWAGVDPWGAGDEPPF